MSEEQSSSGRGLSLLAIVIGVFSALTCLGCAALFGAGWFLDKSIDAMVEQLVFDTGGWFAPEYPEDMPEPDEEEEFEEEFEEEE